MPTTQVKRRRGTTSAHESFIGALAEFTYDTDKKTIVVHDAETLGGFEMLRADMANLGITASNIPPIFEGVSEAFSATLAQNYTQEGGEVNSLLLNLKQTLIANTEYEILDFETGEKETVVIGGADGDLFQPANGPISVPIDPQVLEAKFGSPLILSKRFTQSELAVSPAQFKASVEGVKTADYIGVFSGDRINQTEYTLIGVNAVDNSVPLFSGQRLIVENSDGVTDTVTVASDQTLTAGNGKVLAVEPWTPPSDFISGFAWIKQPSYETTSELNLTQNQAVLKVSETSGEITSLAQVALRASVGSGSELTLSADIINVEGKAQFISALTAEGIASQDDLDGIGGKDIQTFSGDGASVTDTPTNFPDTRSDGGDLQDGDLALDDSFGGLPYVYGGSSFSRAYTVIDGGQIVTGSLNAEKIASGTILGQTIVIGTGSTLETNGGSYKSSGTGSFAMFFENNVSNANEMAIASIGSFNLIEILNDRILSMGDGTNRVAVFPSGNILGVDEGVSIEPVLGVGGNPDSDYSLRVYGDTRLDVPTNGSATAGSSTLPSNPVTFAVINIGGTDYKIPCYGA